MNTTFSINMKFVMFYLSGHTSLFNHVGYRAWNDRHIWARRPISFEHMFQQCRLLDPHLPTFQSSLDYCCVRFRQVYLHVGVGVFSQHVFMKFWGLGLMLHFHYTQLQSSYESYDWIHSFYLEATILTNHSNDYDGCFKHP